MPVTEVNGLKLDYTDTGGDGPAVLFIHGFPFDRHMWDPQVEALKGGWRLLVPDLKGFGSSEAPDNRSSYTVDSYADELKAVLDDAGADKAVLVGLSLGGYIALAFMRKFPEAVTALVLANTRAEADPPEGIEKRTNQQNQVSSEGTAGLIEAMPGALLSEKTKANHPDVADRLRGTMDNPPAGYIGALETMKQRPDSSAGLANIKVPTLVLVGEDDPLIPPDASRSLHEAIGGSRLVVIPEAGHVSNLEAPEAFTKALEEFLSEL
jgi:3-oxoadipate enol-lactonase